MYVCTDVDYRPDDTARAAAVFFTTWTAETPASETVERVENVAPYTPGRFFERELPCLLAVLSGHEQELEAVVIDGYVTLDAAGRPGLGLHLFEALGGHIPVIGVAKTAFQGSPHAVHLQRGEARAPLYVTAVGVDAGEAAEWIREMHGGFRLPTLLKRWIGFVGRQSEVVPPPPSPLPRLGQEERRCAWHGVPPFGWWDGSARRRCPVAPMTSLSPSRCALNGLKAVREFIAQRDACYSGVPFLASARAVFLPPF